MSDPALSMASLGRLIEDMTPRRPGLTAVMHPLAALFLRREYASSAEPMSDPSRCLLDIPVIEDADMEPGAWEIRSGDEVIESGVIRFGITAPEPVFPLPPVRNLMPGSSGFLARRDYFAAIAPPSPAALCCLI